jgi:hypothetical protein
MAQYFSIHPTHPQPRLIAKVAGIVRDGGVIAYPTDSSYALGCHVGDHSAVTRIRRIRGLDEGHLLTLVCRDLSEIARYARIDDWQFRLLKRGNARRLHVPAAGYARGAAAPDPSAPEDGRHPRAGPPGCPRAARRTG